MNRVQILHIFLTNGTNQSERKCSQLSGARPVLDFYTLVDAHVNNFLTIQARELNFFVCYLREKSPPLTNFQPNWTTTSKVSDFGHFICRVSLPIVPPPLFFENCDFFIFLFFYFYFYFFFSQRFLINWVIQVCLETHFGYVWNKLCLGKVLKKTIESVIMIIRCRNKVKEARSIWWLK